MTPSTRIWVVWCKDEPVGVAFGSPGQRRVEYVLAEPEGTPDLFTDGHEVISGDATCADH